MRGLVGAVVLAVVALACDDLPDSTDVRFQQHRPMTDKPLDILKYVKLPKDYVEVQPKPMPKVEQPVETICPFGVDCSHEAQEPQSQEAVMDEGNQADQADSDSTSISRLRLHLIKQDNAEVDKPVKAPAGSDTLSLAEREPNSEFTEAVTAQKAREVDEAMKSATEMALENQDLGDGPPSPGDVDGGIVYEPSTFEYPEPEARPAGMGNPEMPQHSLDTVERTPPEPVQIPSATASPSPIWPSPSPRPSEYPYTYEDEYAPCDEPDPLPAYTSDDMPMGNKRINFPKGQKLPPPSWTRVGEEKPSQILEFEKLPARNQEDSAEVGKTLEAIDTTDRNMLNPAMYQTFALHDDYHPAPFVRKSFRKLSLAGDEMGSYEPSLDKLDDVRERAGDAAEEIMASTDLLKPSSVVEEYRSNELNTNMAWAVMNAPDASTTPSTSPPPSVSPSQSPAPALVPSVAPVKGGLMNERVESVSQAMDHSHMPHSNDGGEVASDDQAGKAPLPDYGLPTAEPPAADEVQPDEEPQQADNGPALTLLGSNKKPVPPPKVLGAQYSERYDAMSTDMPSSIHPTELAVNRDGMFNNMEEEDPLPDVPVTQVPEERRVVYLGNADAVVRKPGVTRSALMPDEAMPTLPHKLTPSMTEAGRKGTAEQAGAEGCDEDAVDDENFAEMATMVPALACAARPSCDECLSESSCVWCPSMEACVDGDESGPASSIQCANDFVYGTCSAVRRLPMAFHPRTNVAQVVDCDDRDDE
jgi:hypothetical protein